MQDKPLTFTEITKNRLCLSHCLIYFFFLLQLLPVYVLQMPGLQAFSFLDPLKTFFLKIDVTFTHPPCFRYQEIFKRNITHCLWQYTYFILEFLRPQVKPSSPGNLLAFKAAQMLDSGSKSQICFAKILCSVTE